MIGGIGMALMAFCGGWPEWARSQRQLRRICRPGARPRDCQRNLSRHRKTYPRPADHAGQAPLNVTPAESRAMITRRRILADTGGIAALAATGAAAAQGSNVSSQARNGMMQIHEAARGRRPRDRRITSLAQCASTRCSRRAIRRAYPADMSRSSRARAPRGTSAWPDADRHVRARLGQAEGGSIEEIRPGDVVWFEAFARTPTTAMTHIAITEFQNGKNVDWLEKVSDEQYRR